MRSKNKRYNMCILFNDILRNKKKVIYYIVKRGKISQEFCNKIVKDKIYIKTLNKIDIINGTIIDSYIIQNEKEKGYSDNDKRLFKKVLYDAKKYVSSGWYHDYIENEAYSFANKYGIEKNVNKEIVAIDINNCYWQTAYNIGVISEKTYNFGLQFCDKKVRNATIGYLNVKSYLYKNENGKDILIREYVKDITYARNDIIMKVYEVAKKISNKLKDDLCFFFTDCFYITKDDKAINEVINILKKYKYEYKIAYSNINDVNFVENNIIVHWRNKKGVEVKNYF